MNGRVVSAGNEGLLFFRVSNNRVGDMTRGGRDPFCASAMLSTRMSSVRWMACDASKALAVWCPMVILSDKRLVAFST